MRPEFALALALVATGGRRLTALELLASLV
jgi:hypothetical protein